MVGAYATTLSYNANLPVPGSLELPVAMGVGVLVTAVFGLVVERTVISGAVPNWISQRVIGRPVIKPLYDRLLDSMVATWGISLIMVQGMRVLRGNAEEQIPTPLGSVPTILGLEFAYSAYQLVLAGAAVAVLALLYAVFVKTNYGMRARATIQNQSMAQSLGINTQRTYMTTFALGSAMAGLTGALYAPVITIEPGLGGSFLVEAFVAVVVGGSSVVVGTSLASGLLGFVNALFSNLYGTFFGQIALLVTAIILIRFLPEGFRGLVDRLKQRRAEAN
jgi:branched-chain amino acid transport system permease protein